MGPLVIGVAALMVTPAAKAVPELPSKLGEWWENRPAIAAPDRDRTARPAGSGRAGVVARAAYDAGCRGRNLHTATAVALAESGGRPGARCKDCITRRGGRVREDSRGLWQINVNAHPQWRSRNLYNPRVNAAAMFEVSGGCRHWRPWSMWKNGTYRRHLPAARRAAARRI
jgi:hypothetical protein